MKSTDSTLEPLGPSKAARLYYESRADELADRTLECQKHHVGQFVDWLAEEEINDMNDVTARSVHRFKLAIKDSIKHNTLALRLGTVRQFLQFCASIDAVQPEGMGISTTGRTTPLSVGARSHGADGVPSRAVTVTIRPPGDN